jgi:hypothetical protein
MKKIDFENKYLEIFEYIKTGSSHILGEDSI